MKSDCLRRSLVGHLGDRQFLVNIWPKDNRLEPQVLQDLLPRWGSRGEIERWHSSS
jgi:hypothetical protein